MSFAEIKSFLLKHKFFVIIIGVYLLFRLINLTLLPVFNDEAIYLDWGWRETTTPGFLFYSLYDAKQPLLMWIFAIAESLFADPLFAGRFVSVVCGLFSLTGIYFLGKHMWNKYVGLLASFLYATSPLFLFYDRQALMESAVATIGIWACFFLIRLQDKPTFRNGLWLGLLLGIGYFIKSSALIFILASILLFIFFLVQEKQKKSIFLAGLITYLTAFIITLPLLMQPIFWKTLPSNGRFSLTLTDYMQFPIGTWGNNILVFLRTNFFFLTPLVFLANLLGLGKLLRKPTNQELVLVLWIFLTIGMQSLVARNASVRYLISFLPLLLLFASYFILQLQTKRKIPAIILLVSIPFIMSLWQIFSPASYILSLSTLTTVAPIEYVRGTTSGYGIPEIKAFIDTHATSLTDVAIAENTGNPESALEMYYEKNHTVTVIYLDQRMLGDVINQYDCINPGKKFYFVSREEQQGGLNKFYVKIKTITNPYGENTWGIYTLKTNCKGATAHLNMTKN